MHTFILLFRDEQKMKKLMLSLMVSLACVFNSSFVLAEAHATVAKSHNIIIKSFTFIPERLEVSVGDTVTWTNKDRVTHNVANMTPFVKASEYLGEGDSYQLKITASMYYICGLHPSMKGEVIIVNDNKESNL